MLRRIVFCLSAIILPIFLLTNGAVSQQKSLKDQVIGTWLYTAIYDQYQDGKKNHTFGTVIRGQITYGSDGRFSQILIGEPRPEFKASDPRRPDSFIIAYYGTFTVNEADKSVSYRVEGAGNSSRAGSEFTNTITSITGDTLNFVGSPRKDQIGTFSPHGELKRAK